MRFGPPIRSKWTIEQLRRYASTLIARLTGAVAQSPIIYVTAALSGLFVDPGALDRLFAGTRLQVSGSDVTGESVWNDGAQGGAGGGGVSSFFPLPAWQQGLEVTRSTSNGGALTMRGVPDVSGDADPETGYVVRIDGTDTVIGGTSAVAPLWAGLIARINAANGDPVGYINPTLYAAPRALRDVTTGDNGDFVAGPGWDACTGLGSPDGSQTPRSLYPPRARSPASSDDATGQAPGFSAAAGDAAVTGDATASENAAAGVGDFRAEVVARKTLPRRRRAHIRSAAAAAPGTPLPFPAAAR
jgi:hypothetical protein